MKSTFLHPVYGMIVYEENFWTGKRNILVNGVQLKKIKKTNYELPETAESDAVAVTVKGSYISGVTLTIGGENITVVEKASTADYILGSLPAILFFIFIMQGAIGGGIAGLMGFGGVLLIKSRPNMKQKLLISLGSSAVIIAIGVAIILYAIYIVSLMQNM